MSTIPIPTSQEVDGVGFPPRTWALPNISSAALLKPGALSHSLAPPTPHPVALRLTFPRYETS
jgi:hypothetical protein